MSKNKKTCLIESCDKKAGTRGLCEAHYAQFNRHKKRMKTEGEREAFEKATIEGGLVLPKKGGRPLVHEDPFAAVAKQVAESKPAYQAMDEEIEQLTEEEFKPAVDRAKSKVAKKKSSQKSNQKRKSQ